MNNVNNFQIGDLVVPNNILNNNYSNKLLGNFAIVVEVIRSNLGLMKIKWINKLFVDECYTVVRKYYTKIS